MLALSERESRRQSLVDGNANNTEEEEADLRRAMEESLAMASEDGVAGLDGIAGTGHLTDDEEAMIRQALEMSLQAEEEQRMVRNALGIGGGNDDGS